MNWRKFTSEWLKFKMTKLLKDVERLAAVVDTLEKRVDERVNDSDGSLSELQHDLDLSLKENAELKNLKQEVGDRLDKVIGQLSVSLEN